MSCLNLVGHHLSSVTASFLQLSCSVFPSGCSAEPDRGSLALGILAGQAVDLCRSGCGTERGTAGPERWWQVDTWELDTGWECEITTRVCSSADEIPTFQLVGTMSLSITLYTCNRMMLGEAIEIEMCSQSCISSHYFIRHLSWPWAFGTACCSFKSVESMMSPLHFSCEIRSGSKAAFVEFDRLVLVAKTVEGPFNPHFIEHPARW